MIQEEQIKKYKNFLKPRLSKKRFAHSENVAKEAIKLAKKYGADKDRLI